MLKILLYLKYLLFKLYTIHDVFSNAVFLVICVKSIIKKVQLLRNDL